MRQQLATIAPDPDSALPPDLLRLGQHRQWLSLSDAYVSVARELNERRAARMGLEWRQPFWNQSIVQTAFSTPERVRLRSENKWLHRQAMKGLLPESVLRRSTKAEFSVAFSRNWAELSTHITADLLAKRADWVHEAEFTSLTNSAFNPDCQEWAMGIAWTLLGLDAVASSHPPA